MKSKKRKETPSELPSLSSNQEHYEPQEEKKETKLLAILRDELYDKVERKCTKESRKEIHEYLSTANAERDEWREIIRDEISQILKDVKDGRMKIIEDSSEEKGAKFIMKNLETEPFKNDNEIFAETISKREVYELTMKKLENDAAETESKLEECNAKYEEKIAEFEEAAWKRFRKRCDDGVTKGMKDLLLMYPYQNKEAAVKKYFLDEGCYWHVGEALTRPPENVPPSVVTAYYNFFSEMEQNQIDKYTAIGKYLLPLSLDERKILISILISHGITMLLLDAEGFGYDSALDWAVTIVILEYGEWVFDSHDRLVTLIKRIRGLSGDIKLLLKFYERRERCNCLKRCVKVIEDRPRKGFCYNCNNKFKFMELKKCSRCDIVHYCCKECQKSHWRSSHKTVCNDMKSKTVHDWDTLLQCLSQQAFPG